MLWEAHGGNPINSYSQDGDDQMDKSDPVWKKWSSADTRDILLPVRLKKN